MIAIGYYQNSGKLPVGFRVSRRMSYDDSLKLKLVSRTLQVVNED